MAVWGASAIRLAGVVKGELALCAVGVAAAGEVTWGTQRVRRPGLEISGRSQAYFRVAMVDVVDFAAATQLFGLFEGVLLALVVTVVAACGGGVVEGLACVATCQ